MTSTLLLCGMLAFAAVDTPRARLEALTTKAEASALITTDEAAQLRADLDALGVPPPSEQAPEPMDWVSFVARWIPRVGGLALALGLLLWLGRALRRASERVRAAVSALLAGGLWLGAGAVDGAGHPTTAGALVLAGCLASAVAVAMARPGFVHRSDELKFIGGSVTLIWGAVACLLASSAAAFLAAAAFAVTVGGDELDDWDLHSVRLRHRALLAGALLVGAAYAVRILAPESVALLVHPMWIVGLGAAFAGTAMGWSWRIFDEQSRWLTFALAGVSTAWGVWAEQGVFAAAGGVALVVWGFACLVEVIPRRVPESVKLMAAGAALLGLTVPIDRHWPRIVEVVSRGW